jgi:DNA-directed RNA polymerase specialized sigma24 family protein
MGSKDKRQKELAVLFGTVGKKSNKAKPSDFEILSFGGQLPKSRLERELLSVERRITELEKSDRKREVKKAGRPPIKRNDFSEDFDQAKLTDAQREVASFRFEYELSIAEIARRIGRHRSAVQERLDRATSKMSGTRAAQERQKRRAVHASED